MPITIRHYQEGDATPLRGIFYNSIHQSCNADYSPAQLMAWAPENYEHDLWQERIAAINPFIALIDKTIVGYADVQADGYIDHFFCHPKFRGRGVAKALMLTIFEQAKAQGYARLYSQVSITAKPFFEYSGFQVVTEQEVLVRGETLRNYLMEYNF